MDIEPPKDAVGVWEKDEAVAACRNCSEPFTTLVRRHHCRGKVFANFPSGSFVQVVGRFFVTNVLISI